MTSDTRGVALRQPDEVDDPLTAVLRNGARRLVAQAVEAEAETFLAEMRGLRLADGRERLVRHGHGPERLMQTGIGPVPVRRVKLRDRGASSEAERIRFTSAPLPRWARRTRSLDAGLPILYLRGVLPAWCVDGRLPGGAGGPARPGRAQSLARGDRAVARRMASRLRPLATGRPLRPALRLSLGRWGLPAGPHGAAGRVHAGADRRHPGGEEGAGRRSGRRARERAELARVAGRPQGTRPGGRAGAGLRRWRPGLLDGARAVFPTTRHQRCRVGGDVAAPTPHRPGRAGFPHPVLHRRASLTAT